MENLTNEDFESYEDYEDYEDYQSKKSAPAPKLGGNAMLNLKVVNNIAAANTIEIFNPNASVAIINNPSVSALNPFTAADTADAVVGINPSPALTIFFDINGNLVYTGVGALQMTLNVTNTNVSYRQLWESCKTMKFRIYQCMFESVNTPQGNNGISFFYRSTFGKVQTNEITPSSFKDPINPQGRLFKMKTNWQIDCESGLTQSIESGETVTYQLYIDNIQRGLIWNKK